MRQTCRQSFPAAYVAAAVCIVAQPLFAAAPDGGWRCDTSPDGAGWVCVGDVAPPAAEPVQPGPVAPAMAGDDSTAQTPERGAPSAAVAEAPPERKGPYADLDWVERADLPGEVVATLPPYCTGAYVEPDYPQPLDTDPTDFVTEVTAQEAQYWVDERAELRGDVRIVKGNQSVSTEQATVFVDRELAEMPQGVTVREPGVLLIGESAETHLGTGAAQLKGSRFVMHGHHLRGRAEALSRDEDGTLRVKRTSVTRCEPGVDSWSVNSHEIVIKEDDAFGTAKNATLKMGGVPVFWAPRLRFPVSDERVSGFLFPDLGYGDTSGADVALPYYLNLAPAYDLTLTPRYVSKRGVMAEAEFRHLSRWTETEVGGAYMPEDDKFNGVLSLDDWLAIGGDPAEFDPSDRWLATLDHRGWLGDFRTFADLTEVSDDDYLRDLGSNTLSVSSQVALESTAHVEYEKGGLYGRLWTQTFRRLEAGTDPYDRLPGFDLGYERRLFGPVFASVAASYADFDRTEGAVDGTIEGITGSRVHVEPRVSIPMNWPFGFLRLGGGWRYTSYDLDNVPVGVDDSPDRSISFGTVDSGLIFERQTRVLGGQFVHTLEPRLYYLYQERENQDDLPRFDAIDLTFGFSQLFRENRFSGLDRFGDADQLSAALTTRLLAAATGRELFSASVGRIFYFQDREVTVSGIGSDRDRQSSSAYVFELGTEVLRHWRLLSTVVWEPDASEVDESGFALQYRRDNRHIVNLGWRNLDHESRVELNQTDVSAYWPVSKRWAVLGRWNYDVEEEETLEAFGGIEYNTCCWQLRIVGRQFLKNSGSVIDNVEKDKGVFLQIVLRGFAGFGGRADQVMRRGIPGYSAKENLR